MNGSENMVMPVSPMYAGANGGFGGWGDNGAWWILILLFALGGWGNGYGGYGGGFANEAMWPYFYNTQTQNDVNRGFDSLGLSNQLSSIQSAVTSGFGDTALGIAGINQNICSTGGNITSAINSGFSQAEIAANSRQMANMNQMFTAQNAINQSFNDVQAQLAQCCCDNRLATCQTQNIIQNEGNTTRFADANNTRDIIQSQTAGTQAILDKLCQLELDGVKAQVDAKNDRISELQTQLNMATLRESQTAQNAFISQGFANEVDQLYNRLNNCPVPTTPVYGRTPIFTCNQNSVCGCGCGNF